CPRRWSPVSSAGCRGLEFPLRLALSASTPHPLKCGRVSGSAQAVPTLVFAQLALEIQRVVGDHGNVSGEHHTASVCPLHPCQRWHYARRHGLKAQCLESPEAERNV